MAASMKELLGVRKVGEGEYESTSLPIRMGNVQPIAYGGFTQCVAVHAACRTVPPAFRLYSVLGHFHGPTALGRPVRCRVTQTRNTRSFATRRVEVLQEQDPKQGSGGPPITRTCLELIADFHVVEPAGLRYSPAPSRPYAGPGTAPTREALQRRLAGEGKLTDEQQGGFAAMFSINELYWDIRHCPEGLSGQNLGGAAIGLPTDQDRLPMPEKSSAEWYRVRESAPLAEIGGDGEVDGDAMGQHWAALAFLMDGGLAFLPVVHDKMPLEEGNIWSSLDFALRIFKPSININEWHLKERVTQTADAGRTYGESRLFNQQGELVASETQQCILRMKKPKAAL